MNRFLLISLLLLSLVRGYKAISQSLPLNPSANLQHIANTSPTGRTPQELGTEYLELVKQAQDSLADLPADTFLVFPLGVNFPIRMAENEQSLSESQQLIAIAFVDSQGLPQPFTVQDVQAIFDLQIQTLSSHTSFQPMADTDIDTDTDTDTDADAESEQRPQVPVIDLIVYNSENNQTFLVKKIRWVGVVRDMINAGVNNEFQPNNYDLRIITPNQLPTI